VDTIFIDVAKNMDVEAHIRNTKPLELNKKSVIHLFLVYHRVTDRFNAALKPFDVSLPQFNVLRILRGMKGKPAHLGTLNERMVTPMSNTTRLVDKLVRKGLVTRRICPTNRRKIEIQITVEGLKTLNDIDPVIESVEHEVLGNMSPRELEELNALLDRIHVGENQ
jgi:DNA-binding MarR family transcriptional regulator